MAKFCGWSHLEKVGATDVNKSQASPQIYFQLQNKIWENKYLKSSQPVQLPSGQVDGFTKHPSSGLTSRT